MRKVSDMTVERLDDGPDAPEQVGEKGKVVDFFPQELCLVIGGISAMQLVQILPDKCPLLGFGREMVPVGGQHATPLVAKVAEVERMVIQGRRFHVDEHQPMLAVHHHDVAWVQVVVREHQARHTSVLLAVQQALQSVGQIVDLSVQFGPLEPPSLGDSGVGVLLEEGFGGAHPPVQHGD